MLLDAPFVAVVIVFFGLAWLYARGCAAWAGLVYPLAMTGAARLLFPPGAAAWQVPRVAAARHVDEARVRHALEAEVMGRDVGLFGEPTVNVLLLNLALDRQFGRPRRPSVLEPEAATVTAPSR